MGRTELAANLFRITQTEERIKSQQIQEQQELEQTYLDIGREVRNIIERNTGRTPEQLTQPNRQSNETKFRQEIVTTNTHTTIKKTID